jgi:hypothetical protein
MQTTVAKRCSGRSSDLRRGSVLHKTPFAYADLTVLEETSAFGSSRSTAPPHWQTLSFGMTLPPPAGMGGNEGTPLRLPVKGLRPLYPRLGDAPFRAVRKAALLRGGLPRESLGFADGSEARKPRLRWPGRLGAAYVLSFPLFARRGTEGEVAPATRAP